MAGRNRHFVAGYLEARIRDVRTGKLTTPPPRRLRVTLRNGDASTRQGRVQPRGQSARLRLRGFLEMSF